MKVATPIRPKRDKSKVRDNTRLKATMKSKYSKIGKVYCPCIGEHIIFNSEGFHHLCYSSGRARSKKEEALKLSLIPLAVPVIKNATNIDEIRKEKITVFNKKKKTKKEKDVEYFSLIHQVGKKNCKVKVVLRKIGNGKVTFFSIMDI